MSQKELSPWLRRTLNSGEESHQPLHLGIYGDSFADPTNRELCDPNFIDRPGWTSAIADEFLAELDIDINDQNREDLLRGHSHKAPVEIKAAGGTNLWWSFNNFVRDLNRFPSITNAVFVYTNPQRIHSLHDPNHHKAFLTPDFSRVESETIDVNANRDEFEMFLELYYKFSHDTDFNYMLGQAIFNMVNNIAREHDINLVNVLPFSGYPSNVAAVNEPPVDTSNSHGTVIKGLQNICMAEIGSVSGYINRNDYHDCWINPPGHEFYGRDLRLCHMNIPNNMLVAQTVYDALKNNSSDKVIDLYKEGNWHSTPELWSFYNSAPWQED